MEKVAKGNYNFDGEEWLQISKEGKDFISRLLEFDPDKRLTAEKASHDPWIKKYARTEEVEIPIITKALQNMKNFRVKFIKK